MKPPPLSPGPGQHPPLGAARRRRFPLITPATATRAAVLRREAERRADEYKLQTQYCGAWEKMSTLVSGITNGLIVVFSDEKSQQTAANVCRTIADAQFARHGQPGYVVDYDIFRDGRVEEALGQRYLIVHCGSDPKLLAITLPYADRLMLVLAAVQARSCLAALKQIREQLILGFELPQDTAMLAWSACVRNLRFLVRCQWHDGASHAAVFSLMREEEEPT